MARDLEYKKSKVHKKLAKMRQEETRVCARCGNMLFYTKKDHIKCPFCGAKNRVIREGKYHIEFVEERFDS